MKTTHSICSNERPSGSRRWRTALTVAAISAAALFAGCAQSVNTASKGMNGAWASADASQMSAQYLPGQLANAAPDSDRYTPAPPTF